MLRCRAGLVFTHLLLSGERGGRWGLSGIVGAANPSFGTVGQDGRPVRCRVREHVYLGSRDGGAQISSNVGELGAYMVVG